MIDDCKKRIPLSPKVMTTKELFEGRRYVIPKYQRDYVWDKEENIKPFVQAIAEGVAKSEDVFLGTTLFRETEDGKFEVMDGRQRLTTLAALSELCGESRGSELFGDEAEKEKVKKEIEEVFTKVLQEVAIASDAHGGADDSDERFKEAFAKQLLENVYFVVVDSKLEIAKTFEIFKSINMTGKPLADEDIVKVIYAEHIAPECKGENNDEKLTAAVKKVDSLYRKIKGGYLKPIDVLQVLQAVLVASKGGTFDDFTQNKVDFFLEACRTNDSDLKNLLSYESVELLFEVCRYVAERAYGNDTFEVEEPKQRYFRGLFEWTRYNRFWLLPYMDVFFRLRKNGGALDECAAAEALKEASKAEALKEASKNAFEMFRLFAVYSVIYKKQVSEINTFVCNEIFPLLKDGCTSEAIAKKIDDKLNAEEGKCVSLFNDYLCNGRDDGLYSNYKRAALVCVMSELDAMLEEKKSDVMSELDMLEEKKKDKHIREALFSWGNKTTLEDAKGKKYNGKYNCDHILARDLFKGSYKTEFCNGIGNLTLLSENDNKSAQNKKPKKKAEDYYKEQNIFVEPRKIAEIIAEKAEIIAEKGWGAAQIAARQNERTAKIWEFLRLDETGVKPDRIEARDVAPENVDGRTE